MVSLMLLDMKNNVYKGAAYPELNSDYRSIVTANEAVLSSNISERVVNHPIQISVFPEFSEKKSSIYFYRSEYSLLTALIASAMFEESSNSLYEYFKRFNKVIDTNNLTSEELDKLLMLNIKLKQTSIDDLERLLVNNEIVSRLLEILKYNLPKMVQMDLNERQLTECEEFYVSRVSIPYMVMDDINVITGSQITKGLWKFRCDIDEKFYNDVQIELVETSFPTLVFTSEDSFRYSIFTLEYINKLIGGR